MNQTIRTISSHRSALVTLAGLAVAVSLLAGCSKSDDAQAAVKQAGRSFTSISVGDSTGSTPFSEETYRTIENDLSAHAGSDNGYAEAAAVGVAMAKKGQASLAAQKASAAETASLHKARVIRGMINEWLTMSAIAEGAGLFDPSNEIEEIAQIITLREGDIAQYQQQLEKINAEINRHEDKIAQLREKADIEQEQAGSLELQMPRVNATQAAEIAEQVREFTLRADQFELEAIRIEGVVGQLRPQAREIGLNVEKARSQIELLNNARQELRDRRQASQKVADQANQDAQQAQNRISAAVEDYREFREVQARPANEKTLSLTRAALSSLRDARDAIKQVAALTKADATQMLADSLSRQAAGYREESLLYQSLKAAKVSGDWDSMIQVADEKAAELNEGAAQAFRDAASALRSARIRGTESEKIEATAARLDSLGGVEPEPEYDESLEDEIDSDRDADPETDDNGSEQED